MKLFLILSFFLSSFAFAGDKSTAYKIICKPMTINSEIMDCVAKVRIYAYYNTDALLVCASFDLNNDKIACLDIIGNVSYEETETKQCASKAAELEKLECLQAMGTIYNPELSLKH